MAEKRVETETIHLPDGGVIELDWWARTNFGGKEISRYVRERRLIGPGKKPVLLDKWEFEELMSQV